MFSSPVQVRNSACSATTRMESGVKCDQRTVKAGCPPTTSRQSTVWKSIAGTMARCHAVQRSTCSHPSSTAVSWSEKVKAAQDSCRFLYGMRGESTTTGSTQPPTERLGTVSFNGHYPTFFFTFWSCLTNSHTLWLSPSGVCDIREPFCNAGGACPPPLHCSRRPRHHPALPSTEM